MTELNVNEIRALITLLEDPEPEIFHAVRDKIFQLGISSISLLEKAWESSLSQDLQHKLEELISDIQFHNVQTDLVEWLKHPDDCLMGACIIARFQYPGLQLSNIMPLINRISKDLWIELNDHLTALEKTRVMNHIFYEIHKFSPNFNNFYAPQNYYINQVLETKQGNPISLAIIYAAVAQQVDMPVFGVNLPKNFILAYKDIHSNETLEDILFYINPYNKGSVLGRREIDYFLKQQNITTRSEFYTPCSNVDIIKRLINNLINSYESIGQWEKISKLKLLYSLCI